MIYLPRHFRLHELVSPAIFNTWRERAWEFLDSRLLQTLDAMGDRYGPIVVNNWNEKGPLHACGLREPAETQGAAMSQHRFGRAADLHPKNMSPQDMHADILKNTALFPYLTTLEAIESTPTWVHADVRQHAQPQQIWIVNP